MSFRRFLNLPLVGLLIAGLLASSASASSYVWCLSADGDHSVLEFVPAGDCSQDDCAATTGPVATAGLEANSDGCGPCLDIPSSHQWNVSRGRQVDVPVAISADFSAAVPGVFTLMPERTLNPHRLVDSPPRVPDPIRHHRTIVLLI